MLLLKCKLVTDNAGEMLAASASCKCLPKRGQAAREALVERSKADLCHGHTLLQSPRAPAGSQLGLSDTKTAFLLRADMEISPCQRCFGEGNRNACEQTGSAATDNPH